MSFTGLRHHPAVKEEARSLRVEGLSLNAIAERLRVSKGSISLWVRGIREPNVRVHIPRQKERAEVT